MPLGMAYDYDNSYYIESGETCVLVLAVLSAAHPIGLQPQPKQDGRRQGRELTIDCGIPSFRRPLLTRGDGLTGP